MPHRDLHATRLAMVERASQVIGAALLEIQNLVAKQREAVARLNRGYMDMADALHGSHAVGPHSIEDAG